MPNQSLAEHLSNKKTNEFLDRLKKYNERHQELKDELKECEYMINLTKKLIYNICEHAWSIDHTMSDEHTVYVCSKCNLER
jgi:hypothetical protein